MKKLKILIICDRGFLFGGSEVLILNEKEALIKRGHEVKVFSSDVSKDQVSFGDYAFKGFNENSIISWFNRVFNIKAYFKLKQILKEYKPDIIHLHNIFYQVSPSVLLAVGNIPTVLTIHSYELICPTGALIKQDGSRCVSPGRHDLRCTGSIKGYIYEKIKQEIHRILLKNVTMYIAPSESIKRDFMNQRVISSPIRVIYNGIEPSKYEPIKNFNRILYVGRLSKEKGVEILIRALSVIRETISDIYLDIVGNGPEINDLKVLINNLNLNSNIYFHGQVDKDKVMDYYADSTFVVVPSICPEAFSLVGVEALSVGRPVIGSNLGAIPEWLVDKKCGFLFTPESIESLATVSLTLLKNKSLLKKMSRFGYEYSRRFSEDANIRNLENLLFELVNKN